MISAHDLFLVAFLALLEVVLSVDNALVLALMARPLPKAQQRRALTYGLMGAIAFRVAALGVIVQVMRWDWVKYLGGAYLIGVALHHFLRGNRPKDAHAHPLRGFWMTVVWIEIMDIAFAVDSILAAVALTKKFWIVFLGGIIGVVMMRFAAMGFIQLLHRFPKLERTAFLLVLSIGVKVIVETLRLPGADFHAPANPAFIAFWSLTALIVASGLMPKRESG